MKIRSILLTGLVAIVLAGCASSGGGGGGGLFGGGATGGVTSQHWDLMMLLQSPACALGFPGRGASINPAFPGGYFPGVQIDSSTGVFSGDVPEVKILAYILGPTPLPGAAIQLVPPPVLAPGDRVKVSFAYKTEADGLHGDYFLVRIADGDLFRVPLEIRREKMADGVWHKVNYSYESQSSGMNLMFITGLSQAGDQVLLDNVNIWINGVSVVYDNLGEGDYTIPAPVGPAPTNVVPAGFVRYPFLPFAMQGQLMGHEDEGAFGGMSLAFTGGSYFTLDGMGGSSGGFSGAELMYTEPNAMTPYFGQTQAALMLHSYLGTYEGFNSSVNPTCVENGQALISIDPKGNSDLSGTWMLQLKVACENTALNFGVDGPEFFGTTSVFPQVSFFSGGPFSTMTGGDGIFGLMGLSLGNSGFFTMNSAVGSAVLFGGFDKTTGVFAGQIAGTIPIYGQACNITSGQFVALIGDAPLPPPP